jgi:hypothetical protein
MRAETRFQNLATVTDRVEPLTRGLAATVVSSQIAQRLFALKHRRFAGLEARRPSQAGCLTSAFRHRPIAGHVGAISASGQSHFHRARGKSVRLRPNKRELLEPGVLCGFAVATVYSRSHFASSRAQ